MSTDYEDKEREFLEYLKADTGRDLAEWMHAIREADLAHRNEIIDWLRQQGFIFSWASWLERIHHNGGRPIYLDATPPSLTAPPRSTSDAPATTAPPPPKADKPKTPAPKAPFRPVLVYTAASKPAQTEMAPTPTEPPVPTPSAPRPTPPRIPPPQAPAPAGSLNPISDITALIGKAKAYAPLASFVLRTLREALPDASIQVTGNHISCGAPETFAILVPSAKDIKLGLALAEAPFERNVVRAKFSNLSPGPPKSITHMLVLTDARQIDSGLLDLLRSANASVNR